MNLTVTLSFLIFGAGLIIWANWRERKDTVPGNPPLISYPALQFLGVFIVIIMAAHLITLLTGKPFAGRRGF